MSRISKTEVCQIRELDAKHLDPWNIGNWKDWEFCQGSYRKIYSIDINIDRRELYLINEFIKQMNAETKADQFLLATKLGIVLEKKKKYDSLLFYIFDTKSKITREYTIQYKWINKKEVEVINGFRTRTELEDNVLETGYNIDRYNQLGRKMASYYLDLDRPHYTDYPMNPDLYSYTNTPNNLYRKTDKIPERSGTFNAQLFNSPY